MFATYWFFRFILRDPKQVKAKPIRHYFETPAPEGHVPDESEIAYWLPKHL